MTVFDDHGFAKSNRPRINTKQSAAEIAKEDRKARLAVSQARRAKKVPVTLPAVKSFNQE